MPKHNPTRFEKYIELPDQSGFTINGTDYVFKYDEDGGWEDEFGNRYDKDGEPIYSDRDYSDEDDEDNESVEKVWSDYEDEYEKEYGPYEGSDDDEEPVTTSELIMEKIGKNMSKIKHHPLNEPLRVSFQILDIGEEKQPTQKEIYTYYSKKIKGIINIIYEHINEQVKKEENQEGNQEENGVFGYFVMKDVISAEALVALEGENIVGFDFTFNVEDFDKLKADPLSKTELKELIKEKYIAFNEDEKAILMIPEGDGGFECSPKQFNTWIQQSIKKNEYKIIKLKKDSEGHKVPIIKIKKQHEQKLSNLEFNGKKVRIEDYIGKQKKNEESQKHEDEKPKEQE